MRKFNISLKWRFTLLTMVLIAFFTSAMMLMVNQDIQQNIPMTLGEFPLEYNAIYSYPATPTENLALSTDSSIVDAPLSIIPAQQYESAMSTAVSDIRLRSYLFLGCIILLGGVAAYFTTAHALKPVRKLNQSIKTMSHQNLTSNLAIDGPHDEIKELALSFNQLIARLDHAFSSQKQFNGSVAHELKTPLAIARTNIEALEEQECVTTQQYQDTLAMIKQSMIGMNQVVEALLDLAQHDNAPLNDCVQLEDLLEDIFEDMSPLADARQITITTEIAPNLPPLAGNQILLYRGISNIIENSIKYNHDQGKINLACWVEESKISILISDTGKGIAPEHIGHIFEPFYRAEGVNIRSLDGIGLGLAMSKSTIELHGGTITMESLIDCGTTVSITLTTTPCPNC